MGFLIHKIWQILKRFSGGILKVERKPLFSEERVTFVVQKNLSKKKKIKYYYSDEIRKKVNLGKMMYWNHGFLELLFQMDKKIFILATTILSPPL